MSSGYADRANPASTFRKRPSIHEIETSVRAVRTLILEMTSLAGSGHPGASFSVADIIGTLYFGVMRYDPLNPEWKERDRLILSKGHAVPAVYAALALAGFFPLSELKTLRRLDSRLPGHPDAAKTPGVEMSSGSLGQGLSFAIGVALGARVRRFSYRTYVLLGDGECNEGQIWEAAMLAPQFRLGELVAIVDRNDSRLEQVKRHITPLEPLAEKWTAFGWRVIEVDGHSVPSLLEAFSEVEEQRSEKPTMILAHTIKGGGLVALGDEENFQDDPLLLDELEKAVRRFSPTGDSLLRDA